MTQTTPAGVTVQAVLQDGSIVDVTEGVQALYDLVIQSMDWGSGFLTVEDALPVAHIARVCGFESSEEAEKYVREEQHKEEERAFQREREAARLINWPVPTHEHVYSKAKGQCMYYGCYEMRPE